MCDIRPETIGSALKNIGGIYWRSRVFEDSSEEGYWEKQSAGGLVMEDLGLKWKDIDKYVPHVLTKGHGLVNIFMIYCC